MGKIKKIFSWIFPITIGLLLAFIIHSFFLVPVKVDGDSMLNNLQNGQRVWAFKLEKIHRG
ncbi:S26 family signal peptidase, partial [Oenococcus oeni]